MARRLDPKLEQIIEDASRNAQSLDTSDPSAITDDFTRTVLNSHLERCQPMGEPGIMVADFQKGHSILNNFGRSILQPDNASRHLDSDSGLSQLLPSIATYKNLNPKLVPPSLYERQIIQQQPVDERAYIQALQATAAVERPQDTEVVLHKHTIGFQGVKNKNIHPALREPKTPLNLPSCAYTTPGKMLTTPSSGHEISSPSTRISLRRTSNLPAARTLPKAQRSDFDEELMLNPSPQVQGTINAARAISPLKFTGKPPSIQGIQMVSPHELPDRFRQVFPYGLFNAVQSKCFAPIYKTGDNVVVSAPTGSGKTVILELAICRLVQEFGSEQFKIVYQAPTKSLCSERMRDWTRKFSHLNLPCAELTGDTDNSEMRKVGNAAIIVTTPEKWDSITRKWKDHVKLLHLVKLVLIDEVHILKDPRGATLEAVVSRMKSIGTNVRFVALSATVPNSDDIATWLGRDHANGHLPAHRETFGEEFRPVKLQKFVYGYSANINDFAFDTFLDTKLPGLIAKHTIGKPMMVFCITRKICESTAAKLAAWWSGLHVTERPWPIPLLNITVGSPELRDLVGCGVAFHHAGLDVQDRIAVEAGFLRDGLSVICCTSTLAIGVNLPCHLVVIKNTICYKDAGLSEYSDLEVMQMLGRAGRPQFDDSATSIIITRTEKADRYKLMISGQDVLESTLHLNVIEHLNSEIGLGTVHDVSTAKRWLAGTFLSVRMRKNPTYYKFDCDTGSQDADERLERVCEKGIEVLKNTKLITEDQHFTCTEYGQAMAKYMVQFETMKLLLGIPKNAKMIQILHFVSQSSEFKDVRMKPNERGSFREFNKSPFIKLPIKENIITFAHKVSLIIQIHLGGVDLPMGKEFNIIKRQFQSEKVIIFERMLRLIRCVVECKAYECDGVATCNALELLRSVAAGYWENSTLQLRQLPTIGPAAVRKLVQSNVKTIGQLAAMDSAAIERVMSRNPPFGKKILDVVTNFPRLTIQADIKKMIVKAGEPTKLQVKAQVGFLNARFPVWNRKVPTVTFTAYISDGNLAHIWRGPLKRLEKGFDLTFTCELSQPSDIIFCQLACEEIVGTIQSVELKPEIPASSFPSSKPIIPLIEIAPNTVADKVLLSTEEAEIFALLEEEDYIANAGPGSDYGRDSVFDDFVNIDDLEVGASGENGGPEAKISEPVQMENGKWRCNHKCRDAQGIYLTKNGVPCKHLCCHEGLDRPRKIQKKRLTDSDNVSQRKKAKVIEKILPKAKNKPSKETSKLVLKLNEHPESFKDIEELDLVNSPFEVETPKLTPRQYTPTPGMLSNEGKPGPGRLLKKVPHFSYASGLQQNLSLIGHFDQNDWRSPDFLLTSPLLGNEDPFKDNSKNDSEAEFLMLSDTEFELPATTDTAAPAPIKSLEHNDFSFNRLENLETAKYVHNSTSNKKRTASPSPKEPEAEFRRDVADDGALREVTGQIMLEEEVIPNLILNKPLPAWVAEFDQDLISFFGDSVEYED